MRPDSGRCNRCETANTGDHEWLPKTAETFVSVAWQPLSQHWGAAKAGPFDVDLCPQQHFPFVRQQAICVCEPLRNGTSEGKDSSSARKIAEPRNTRCIPLAGV